jgi:uncharacterized protein YegL
MMLFKTGIYSALFSLSHGYLMPGQTDKIVYADTRILDPRYARSAENLVCQSEVTHDVMKHLPTGGGGKGGKPAVQEHTEMRAIGCCPAGDPNGKPYGVGKGCCGSNVFEDDGNSFCCEYDMQVYQNTLMGITQCNNNFEIPETEPINGPTAGPQIAPSEFPSVPEEMPYDADPEYLTTEGQCPPAFWIPSPMTASCTDSNNVDSFCSFQCPPGSRVRIPDDPNRVCNADGTWHGDVPHCCERDGCPDDLRVDFYFILDSSSSIKEKNFQYIREYVMGLIKTMPIGQDKTRVGIITYNSDVIERVRLDQFDDKRSLMEAVQNIPYEGRGTKTNAALEYAVMQGLIEEKGDRPDVPNFILVLTDGRSTDDVSVGAPALQQKGFIIAVGVGKKIKEPELITIAGNKDNVYMVADFRNLNGLGTLSDMQEGETVKTVSEEEQSRRRKECIKKELAEANGQVYESEHVTNAEEAPEIIAQLAVIEALEAKYEADNDIAAYAVAMRGERIRLTNLRRQYENGKWTTSLCRPNALLGPDQESAEGAGNVKRFTTSFICPKQCLFETYSIFSP